MSSISWDSWLPVASNSGSTVPIGLLCASIWRFQPSVSVFSQSWLYHYVVEAGFVVEYSPSCVRWPGTRYWILFGIQHELLTAVDQRWRFAFLHISAAAWAPLAAGPGADPVPMRFGVPLPSQRRVDISCRQPPSNRRHRRSSPSYPLIVAPTNRSTLGDRALPVAVSRAWNGLPSSVRATSSLLTFCQELKIFLFQSSFQWLPWSLGWSLIISGTAFSTPVVYLLTM